MNKLFLTLLAAALPAAAEVELYGNIRSGVEAVHSSRPSGSETTAAVRDFGSYVGIKGRIPLGSQGGGHIGRPAVARLRRRLRSSAIPCGCTAGAGRNGRGAKQHAGAGRAV